MKGTCQPPREAVSWNMSSIILGINALSQPPREAVSWNIWGIDMKTKRGCQPPREAVSWNTETGKSVKSGSPSASSWGCELKYTNNRKCRSEALVSLLVRLWVEIIPMQNYRHRIKRQPPREAVSWNMQTAPAKLEKAVSLLVRLWVEINLLIVI